MSVIVSEGHAVSSASSVVVDLNLTTRTNPIFTQAVHEENEHLDVVYSYQSVSSSTSEALQSGVANEPCPTNVWPSVVQNDGITTDQIQNNILTTSTTETTAQPYEHNRPPVTEALQRDHGFQSYIHANLKQSDEPSEKPTNQFFDSGAQDYEDTNRETRDSNAYHHHNLSSSDPSSLLTTATGEVNVSNEESSAVNFQDKHNINQMDVDWMEQEMHQDRSSFIGPVVPSSWKVQTEQNAGDTPANLGINEQSAMHLQESSHIPTVSDESYNNMFTTSDLRYNLTTTSVPILLTSASNEFQGNSDENFLRGCKWSPDGSLVLTNSNDNCFRLFGSGKNVSNAAYSQQMVPRVKMKEGSQIYDFAWHPKMSVTQTDYCRIACTCAGIPIHLWDSTKGQIVASYRAYDQFDEITAAYSLSFSLDGSKIYAGYNKAIRIFDTDYPVRSCKTIRTFNSQKKDGQMGIISCFTHSPDGNGLYVAGSYSRHIGIYDSACDKLVCLMQGQQGGVTHLMFSSDATKLYSGGRKDAEILCWDMRNMGRILFAALRDVRTNQRMYFDLSQSGRYLVSGNNDGSVAFWDTLSPAEEVNGDMFLQPCSQFQAHKDCVNGVSFNHQHDMLATASGQRHFRNFDDYDSSDDSDEDAGMDTREPWDFSLRLWQMPLLQ